MTWNYIILSYFIPLLWWSQDEIMLDIRVTHFISWLHVEDYNNVVFIWHWDYLVTVNHGRDVVTMVQTPMTAYLTRGRAQASQSVERIDDEGTVIGSSPRAPIRNKRGLPIKKSQKSKRQLREQKKRARKRERAKA